MAVPNFQTVDCFANGYNGGTNVSCFILTNLNNFKFCIFILLVPPQKKIRNI